MSKAAVINTPPPAQNIALRQEGEALTSPLSERVESLVIDSDDAYEDASRLLLDVRSARTKWDNKITPPIDSIRSGLDGLYELRRGVDRPLEAMETAIKAGMSKWDLDKINKAKEIQAAADRIQQQVEQKRQQAAAATTSSARTRLTQTGNALEQQQALVQAKTPVLAKASGSRRKVVQKWKITDLESFIAALFDPPEGVDAPPLEVFQVCSAAMDKELKERPLAVKAWPGVEVYDDVQIGVK